MKKEIKSALITGVFGLVGTITAAIIGVAAGKDIEQKNTLNEVQATVATIDGDNNQIIFNDISEFASDYVELNAAYTNSQNNYDDLNELYIQKEEELSEAKSEIINLQKELNSLTNNYNADIASRPDVEYSNISLIINGIESGYVDRVVTINNETFYSIGFLKYLVDNQAVSSDASKLFVGNVQSEDKMPISLFNENTYLECGFLSHNYYSDHSFKDNNGQEYFNGVYRIIPNFDTWDTYIECLVDNYETFSGIIILNYDYRASDETARLIVYGDGEVIYASPEITRGVEPVEFSIDITNISLLRIEFTKEYEMISLINPYLYP